MAIDLESVVLQKGNHRSAEEGVCLMEAVALFDGEVHSDKPRCASQALTAFGIQLNDSFDDEYRQKLKPFIPKLVGSRNDELESRRCYFLADRAVRLFAPMALRYSAYALEERGIAIHPELLLEQALRLESLPEVNAASAAASAAAANAAAAAAANDAAYAAAANDANAAYAAASAASAAYAAAAAANDAANAANAAYAAAYAANDAANAAYAAYAYAPAYAASSKRCVWDESIEVFRQAIEIEEVAA